ncbi:cell division protein FtsQ/DivIB [Pseudohongiella spirulinae]|uniref:Cell division protein FtsQ n=1 Tax=Pseudohongiella spirulinae TaxID=1249552 RepID=A0A0S2KG32_9GAMM|nr:cell division protein FtsQ/DivIB [Pseudohongiella spirulinae]ALO46927.1 cell division protein FtsQ [Pseudohongiella spirulinae]
MSERRSTGSFSAYDDRQNSPVDFAPIRAEGRARDAVQNDSENSPVSRARLPRWFLMLALTGVAIIATYQYRDLIVSAMPDVEWPGLNLPQVNRPIINRAINTVRMESPLTNVTEQEVRSLLARYTDSGFLGVDVQDLRDELEQNPWIHSASVRRVWPDILVISLQEEIAVARWKESELINEYGMVFAAPWRGGEEGLPQLSGPTGSESLVLSNYSRFGDVIASAGFRIRALAVDERGSWQMETADGVTIRLGRELVDARLSRFIDAYRRGLNKELADVASIDLRYSNGFSVSKRSAASDAVASR